MPTNLDTLVKGDLVPEPLYRWRCNEDTGTTVVNCSNPSYDGTWIGSRSIVESHNDIRASLLDRTQSSDGVRIPFEASWFSSGNWTLSFWRYTNRPIDNVPTQRIITSLDGSLVPTNRLGLGYNITASITQFQTWINTVSNIAAESMFFSENGLETNSSQFQHNGSSAPSYGSWSFIVIRSSYNVATNETTFSFLQNNTLFRSTIVSAGLVTPSPNNGYLLFHSTEGAAYQDIRFYSSTIGNASLRRQYRQKERKFADLLRATGYHKLFPLHEIVAGNTPEILDINLASPGDYMTPSGSPTIGDGPFLNHDHAWGRKHMIFNSASSQHLSLRDGYQGTNWDTIGYGVYTPIGSMDRRYTFSCWIKLDNLNTVQPIIFIRNAFNGYHSLAVRFNANGSFGIYRRLLSDSSLTGGSYVIGAMVNNGDLPAAVTSLGWFHFALVIRKRNASSIDGHHINAFVNGEHLAYSDWNNGVHQTVEDSAGWIGRSEAVHGGAAGYLDGKISQVMFSSARMDLRRVLGHEFTMPAKTALFAHEDALDSPSGNTGKVHRDALYRPLYQKYLEMI